MKKPRDYQLATFEAIRDAFTRQIKRVIVENCTGSGKGTIVALVCKMARDKGKRVLAIVNRDVLVSQLLDDIQGAGVHCYREQSKDRAPITADCVVGSVQSMQGKWIEKWRENYFDIVITDECFVSGTMVETTDGPRDIVDIFTDTKVLAFDHTTGTLVERQVIDVSARHSNSLVKLKFTNGTEIICTASHPFFTDIGYIPASELTCEREMLAISDYGKQSHSLRDRNRMQELQVSSDCIKQIHQDGILSKLIRIPKRICLLLFRVSKDWESSRKQGVDYCESTYAECGDESKAESDFTRDGVEASDSGRKWEAVAMPSAIVGVDLGMENGIGSQNFSEKRQWLSRLLQVGYWKRRFENRRRNRWTLTRLISEASTGQEKGRVLEIARLESSQVYKPTGSDRPSWLREGDIVYNLEVEGCHNYFANGVLVHNCHFSRASTFAKILNRFPESYHIGLTATAERHDKKALWKGYEEIVYRFPLKSWVDKETGNVTKGAIDEGWLVGFQFEELPVPIVLEDKVAMGKGELSDEEGDELFEKSGYLPRLFSEASLAMRHTKGLAFLPGCKASEACAAAMRENGLNARHVDGYMTKAKINEQLDWFAGVKEGVLCNAQMLTFGYNQPDINCIGVFRLIRSTPTYKQILGRGTRTVAPVDTFSTVEERREAIARSSKPVCIAEGSLVLTDSGLVPIESVTLDQKVWDGACFVSHDGVVFNGEQETITYAGLTATPDHRCWTMGGWKTLAICKQEETPLAVTGACRDAIREADRIFIGDTPRFRRSEDAHGVSEMRQAILAQPIYCVSKLGGLQEVFPSSKGTILVGSSNGGCAGPMRKCQKQSIRSIWWERDKVLLRLANGSCNLDRTESWLASRDGTGSKGQFWKLRAGKSTVGNSQSESIEHSKVNLGETVPSIQIESSRDKILRRDIEEAITNPDRRGNNCAVSSTFDQTKRRVWDILNCGPGNRFTVNGVLVHNCRVIDLMIQNEDHNLATPSCLITDDKDEQKALNAALKKGSVDMSKMDEDLSKIRIADKEKQLAKLASDAAQAAEKVRHLQKEPYIRHILMKRHNGNNATDGQQSYLKKLGYKGDCAILSKQQAYLITEVYKKHNEKLKKAA